MPQSYIFSVGKPDMGAQSVRRIHDLGFKAGIFVDSASKSSLGDLFDVVIPFDFTDVSHSIEGIPIDLSIAGLICTYENYIPAKAAIASQLGVPSISIQSAKLCTDKTFMREAFIHFDTTISPNFQEIKNYDDAERFAKTHGYPVIIKPAGLVKSLLVMRCDNPEELHTNVTTALQNIGPLYQKYGVLGRKPKLLIEQFITGQMYSVAGFVDKSGTLHYCNDVVTLTTAQQHGCDDSYLYCRSLPSAIDNSLKVALLDTAQKGVTALKMTSSPAHVELIVDGEENIKIIEIGARTGGYRPRMYNLSYETDLLLAEIQIALGQKPLVTGTLKKYTAVYEVFPKQIGTYMGHTCANETHTFAYFSEKASIGKAVGPAKNGFRAAVIIIVSEKDYDTFLAQCNLAESVEVEVE